MKKNLHKRAELVLDYLASPVGLTCLGLLMCVRSAEASMSIASATELTTQVGAFFTGTGFKVGMGVTTALGMVVAGAKHSMQMAAMVMVIGLVGSIWITKFMTSA